MKYSQHWEFVAILEINVIYNIIKYNIKYKYFNNYKNVININILIIYKIINITFLVQTFKIKCEI